LERSVDLGFCSLRELTYSGGLHLGSHCHDRAYIHLAVSGQSREVMETHTTVRNPGSVAYAPQAAPHAHTFLNTGRSFEIYLQNGWPERLGGRLPERPVLFEEGPAVSIMRRLRAELYEPDDVTPVMTQALLLEIAALMARRVGSPEERRAPRWLSGVRDYLHDNVNEPVSLDALAQMASVHPSHLTRAFRSHFRCTVGEYVRNLRVERAKHLLVATSLPLAEVALDAGFANQSHFSRVFRDYVGTTPAQFRSIGKDA
jgi:AraC family transcriptional regulator